MEQHGWELLLDFVVVGCGVGRDVGCGVVSDVGRRRDVGFVNCCGVGREWPGNCTEGTATSRVT